MTAKMTLKEEFCLRRLSERSLCSYDISEMAIRSGDNRTACQYEWADAPLRGLRVKGWAEKTGNRSRFNREVHRITDLGRAALAEEVR